MNDNDLLRRIAAAAELTYGDGCAEHLPDIVRSRLAERDVVIERLLSVLRNHPECQVCGGCKSVSLEVGPRPCCRCAQTGLSDAARAAIDRAQILLDSKGERRCSLCGAAMRVHPAAVVTADGVGTCSGDDA